MLRSSRHAKKEQELEFCAQVDNAKTDVRSCSRKTFRDALQK